MAGAVIGLLSFSRVLKWMFAKYHDLTIAVLTGFLIGSLNKLWPWKETISTSGLILMRGCSIYARKCFLSHLADLW